MNQFRSDSFRSYNFSSNQERNNQGSPFSSQSEASSSAVLAPLSKGWFWFFHSLLFKNFKAFSQLEHLWAIEKRAGMADSSKEMGFLNPNFPFFSESGGAV